ncbi:P-loop containing nucleoside triphosphate hydrolase protein [Blastocladiella britannica]|nr:P-loop containing nucleoside triphosphate hydrolase protein [Blastocladiella britannica]
MGDQITSVKIVIVGTGRSGKTALLSRLCTGKFPEFYTPTVFDAFKTTLNITSSHGTARSMLVHLHDTAGQEEYDRLRPLAYPNTNAAVICFSMCDVATLDDVPKWKSELEHFLPRTPIVLIACKRDVNDSKDDLNDLESRSSGRVSDEDIKRMRKDLKIDHYFTTSSYMDSQDQLRNVFAQVAEIAYRVAKHALKKKGRGCTQQ